MLKLGFCNVFVNWVMCLVSTVSYSFLINGIPKVYIRPTWGVRQGDLLSPYLFLLCGKGLTSMLRSAEERRAISGIRISRESPSISHILFADDTMIFGRATVEEAEVIMGVY
ncbi:hypothetical protein LIER_40809 [Lithospermum erythrorhizon]|uniref:Reverse transcriptase n=1 Tax=Lithospermum erythrorhizon TaxID=34254 RepID=A0AAV3R261_LITER